MFAKHSNLEYLHIQILYSVPVDSTILVSFLKGKCCLAQVSALGGIQQQLGQNFAFFDPPSPLLQIGLSNLNSAIYPIVNATLGSTLKKAIELAVLSNTWQFFAISCFVTIFGKKLEVFKKFNFEQIRCLFFYFFCLLLKSFG